MPHTDQRAHPVAVLWRGVSVQNTAPLSLPDCVCLGSGYEAGQADWKDCHQTGGVAQIQSQGSLVLAATG